jgi:hypothetical protein
MKTHLCQRNRWFLFLLFKLGFSLDLFTRNQFLELFLDHASFEFSALCFGYLLLRVSVVGLFFPLLIVAWFISADFLYRTALVLTI